MQRKVPRTFSHAVLFFSQFLSQYPPIKRLNHKQWLLDDWALKSSREPADACFCASSRYYACARASFLFQRYFPRKRASQTTVVKLYRYENLHARNRKFAQRLLLASISFSFRNFQNEHAWSFLHHFCTIAWAWLHWWRNSFPTTAFYNTNRRWSDNFTAYAFLWTQESL